jgi:hypothetical protein
MSAGDIVAAVRSGAAVQAALAAVYAEGTRRHDDGMWRVIGKLGAAGALRPGLTVPQAVGLLSVLCSVEALADLTTRFGWTAAQCETWTAEAMCRPLGAVPPTGLAGRRGPPSPPARD